MAMISNDGDCDGLQQDLKKVGIIGEDERKCDVCLVGKKTEKLLRCDDCRKVLCDVCEAKLHSKQANKGHVRSPLGSASSNTSALTGTGSMSVASIRTSPSTDSSTSEHGASASCADSVLTTSGSSDAISPPDSNRLVPLVDEISVIARTHSSRQLATLLIYWFKQGKLKCPLEAMHVRNACESDREAASKSDLRRTTSQLSKTSQRQSLQDDNSANSDGPETTMAKGAKVFKAPFKNVLKKVKGSAPAEQSIDHDRFLAIATITPLPSCKEILKSMLSREVKAECIRCITAEFSVSKQLAEELYGLTRCKKQDLEVALMQFKHKLKNSGAEAPAIRKCVSCKKKFQESETFVSVCGCPLCVHCLAPMYNSVLRDKPFEAWSCPNCKKPKPGEDFTKHLKWLQRYARPRLGPDVQLVFDKKLPGYVKEADEPCRPAVKCKKCAKDYDKSEMRYLGECKCEVCENCVIAQLQSAAEKQSIIELRCSLCKKPDARNEEATKSHFQHLQQSLLKSLPKDTSEKIQRMIHEWSLRKGSGFRWCKSCGNGSIVQLTEVNGSWMQCKKCEARACFHCGCDWHQEHVNLGCTGYKKWKLANDETYKQKGLHIFLEEIGITCPNRHCKVKYNLACATNLKFPCRNCALVFCGFCGIIYVGEECKVEPDCASKGLHSHCDVNCLSVGGKSVTDFEEKLRNTQVQYHYWNKNEQASSEITCAATARQDFSTDGPCGRPLSLRAKGSRLCDEHYKEYLAVLLRQHYEEQTSYTTSTDDTEMAKRSDLAHCS